MLPNRRTIKSPVPIAGSARILTATLNSATRWARDGPGEPSPSSSPSSESSASFRAGGGGEGRWGWIPRRLGNGQGRLRGGSAGRGAGRCRPDRVVEPVRYGLAPRCGAVGHGAPRRRRGV
ncbi:hypothetical protein PR202_ga20606 [Eleusine coracana subsp. coracana]|uniref:Uncharacterized protein n=1 Tax=Eleusine coracana subsp. coracana TaxID=191504 RepID=A0AAV5CX41_ELECO|nr:hypothetical protein PR202_ga20606 [Eleusine coracana subsp. coracana]